MIKNIKWILFANIFIIFFLNSIFAGTIKLEWDPNSDSNLAGYKVHYGYESQNYSFVDDVGNVTTHTLTNLTDCTIYYIVVTSYDYSGNESDYSNEVSGWSKPIIDVITPSDAEQGEQNVLVSFSGINFDEGSQPKFDTQDIAVNDHYINNCGEMVADITLKESSSGRPAQMGLYSVWIVNSNGIRGYSPIDFEIKLNVKNCDVDGDTLISAIDLHEIASCWGTQEGEEYYNPACDINGDGWIDGEDLALLFAHYREHVI